MSPSTHDPAPGDSPAAPTVATLLKQAAATTGIAPLDAQVLLAALMRRSRAQLLAFDDTPVDPLTTAMFQAGLERRAAGEPLAYITGVREFWSLPLVVSPDVLVPRPETELLVERCLALLGADPDPRPRRVADLGTGSLAIAAALARERPHWRIIATDRSPDALAIAAINRQRLNLPNIDLREGRWCAALASEELFDAILSNPPYVAPGDPALAALQSEPQTALVAADHGYADLLTIAAQARHHLLPGGALLLEHGATQAARVAAELVRLGYADVVCRRDLAGLDRITEATWNPSPP
ncbi:MAG: peptide chain release factor N(5)-glutamine methyltransferase [Nevskiaceae bacterium]|jgi:release factor glutamine methyltransferase|nr:peptide chain release factor N(5)-glutamine methyltransferase [Nevskiaceae bacterium]